MYSGLDRGCRLGHVPCANRYKNLNTAKILGSALKLPKRGAGKSLKKIDLLVSVINLLFSQSKQVTQAILNRFEGGYQEI